MKRFAYIFMAIALFVPVVFIAYYWPKAESSCPKKNSKKSASDEEITCVFTDTGVS